MGISILKRLNKATEDYHRRLVEQLRLFVSAHTFEHAHRTARAHAGGRASPKRPPAVTFADRASLVAALNSGVLAEASDADLARMHEMVHRVMGEHDDDIG